MSLTLSELSTNEKEDMVVSLATLICHDAGIERNADNINALAKATNNQIQPFWGYLFTKLLEGKDVDDILMKPSMAAPAAGGAAPAGGAGGAAGGAAAEEEEAEESEESAGGAGGGLFDSDSDSD
eukprot:gb/GECG01012027.1/.p1 GENE.gb/GECG01012027.1/~~gb/GECG01012027.1/.p1  ORF type:complete len:125 (+),score=38.58 gb/GECG01012027.1/:1-375(+)